MLTTLIHRLPVLGISGAVLRLYAFMAWKRISLLFFNPLVVALFLEYIGHSFVTAAFIRLLTATFSSAAVLKRPDDTIGQVPVSQKTTCRSIMIH
jgi:hypothetical protein